MAEQTTEPRVYCTCKWLERAAAEPSHPIEYVELTNEYRLITQYPAGRGYAPLYYCPGCGKSAPKSRVGSSPRSRPRSEVASRSSRRG